MKYDDIIDKLKKDTNDLYEKMGALRDAATLQEKEYYNALRRGYDVAWHQLSNLQNMIREHNRHDMELKGEW